jgi:ERF superfamily
MKHLFKSLAEFQQEVPTIHKATQGYGYTYADLPKIFEVINPLLKKHGLGFTQLINGTELVTIVFHVETGETIESKTAIPQGVQLKGMNDFQVLGSAISYLRRYCISSILGIVSDKDTDAGGEQVKAEPKNEVKKVAIDDKRLAKAIKAITEGEYTTEELLKTFELTPEQLKNIAQ